MSGCDNCCPFILRFSRSMLHLKEHNFFYSVPRSSGTSGPDIKAMTDRVRNGISFYNEFEYNRGQKIFSRISVKPDSFSKSLRYHFLKYTGIKLHGSLSINDFFFSVSDRLEINKIETKLENTKNSALLASLTHISDMEAYLPDDKAFMSQFVSDSHQSVSGNRIIINSFTTDRQSLLNFLSDGMGLKNVRNCSHLPYSVYAEIPDLSAKAERIFSHCLVRSLSKEDALTLTPDYLRHEDMTLDCVEQRDFGKKYPMAAIADSGLADSSFLKEWELDSIILADGGRHSHGTFVTGRLLKNDSTFGGILFLNIELMPSDGILTPEELYEKMRLVLIKYHTYIKIYNLSMGSSSVASMESFSETAYILDRLQSEFDVLFIISAGNYDKLRYGDNPLFGEDRITSPAESVNAITVGSVAHTDTNIQMKNSPSLFTRRGPGPCGLIKPDICAYGGAHESRMGKIRPVGVFSIGTRNELAEDTGTSHAVPRVTAAVAKIYDTYSHVFKSPDMARSILIHHTRLLNDKAPSQYTGYGILEETSGLFNDFRDSAVYLHSGYVLTGYTVEIPGVPIPKAMFDGAGATGSIKATLVYKPETDILFPHFYTCVNLELSIGFYDIKGWKSIVTSKDMITLSGLELTDQTVKENLKWHPVKIYEKNLKNKIIPEQIVLRLAPSKRDFYHKTAKIDYSLVLSFTRKGTDMFSSVLKCERSADGLLEPSSDMWKNC